MAALRVLAIAVASGRAGYAYFSGKELVAWGGSRKASEDTSEATGWAQTLVNDMKPDVVVTEKLGPTSKKGPKTRSLIRAIAELASHNYLLDVSVTRPQTYASKYEQAEAIARRYPEVKGWVPAKRKFYDNEPKHTVLFEAIALAEEVIFGSPLDFATAVG